MSLTLIGGLGDPEPRYYETRHNFGFLLADRLAEKFSWPREDWAEKYHSHYQKKSLRVKNALEREILLVKPTTYMNASGQSIQAWKQFYKIPNQDILILVDDYDLPFGHLRFRPEGSDGGHNGLRDIIEKMGRDFPRLRLGIRQEIMKSPMASYVQEKFDKEELAQLTKLLDKASEAVLDFLELGVEKAMNRWNGKSLLEP